jgi:hypothetical protein
VYAAAVASRRRIRSVIKRPNNAYKESYVPAYVSAYLAVDSGGCLAQAKSLYYKETY